MNADVITKMIAHGKSRVILDRGLLRITGGDRVRYLNGQVTNDVAKISLGHTCYAAICTVKGRMISDLWISNIGEEFWLDTGRNQILGLKERLEKYIIADDVDLSEVKGFTLVHYWGEEPPTLGSDSILMESMRFGIKGYDVWQRGEIAEEEGLDRDSLKLLRILNRVPEWGNELSVETLPPEAGMDRNAIRYDKGCYVGQEVMARIKSIGHVSKRMVLLEGKLGGAPREGAKLVFEGKEVGWVTSACLNPFTGTGVALGYLMWGVLGKAVEVIADDLVLTIQPENA